MYVISWIEMMKLSIPRQMGFVAFILLKVE